MNRQSEKEISMLLLILLSIPVGIVAGLGAVLFRGLISFIHNLFFLGKLSFLYDANQFTPSNPLGIFIILVPVLGAIGVAFLVKNFAPEAEGHGVPEVIDAIYYNRGKIRPVVALVKSLASALSIGTGGSVGREGPIIQIGSSFGSSISQLLRICTWQRITMIAAGAAGGIAATFNTPIGGILFATEIMMHEISIRTIVPVAISTEVAVYIGRLVFGSYPSFVVPKLEITYFHLFSPWLLLIYGVLGVFTGIISAVFIKSIYGFEDFFKNRINGSYYRRHMLGMLVVGILMYLLYRFFGHYYIEGVGYATIQSVLSGGMTSFYLLIFLFFMKLLAVSLTLGSGASGGIFSPGLFMGATFGGAFGILVHAIFPGIGVNVAAFAVAGMAGVIAGSTGAALTSVVMMYEMTLDYNVIIPMTVTIAISYVVRVALEKDSIYAKKLVRRGHFAPTALQVNYSLVRKASDMMEKNFEFVSHDMPTREFLNLPWERRQKTVFLLTDDSQKIRSVILTERAAAIRDDDPAKTLGDYGGTDFIRVRSGSLLGNIVSAMKSTGARAAIVIKGGDSPSTENVIGVITERNLLDALTSGNDLFYMAPK